MTQSENATNDRQWVHSVCTMCIGAPMKVRVRNGKIVEVKVFRAKPNRWFLNSLIK